MAQEPPLSHNSWFQNFDYWDVVHILVSESSRPMAWWQDWSRLAFECCSSMAPFLLEASLIWVEATFVSAIDCPRRCHGHVLTALERLTRHHLHWWMSINNDIWECLGITISTCLLNFIRWPQMYIYSKGEQCRIRKYGTQEYHLEHGFKTSYAPSVSLSICAAINFPKQHNTRTC